MHQSNYIYLLKNTLDKIYKSYFKVIQPLNVFPHWKTTSTLIYTVAIKAVGISIVRTLAKMLIGLIVISFYVLEQSVTRKLSLIH